MASLNRSPIGVGDGLMGLPRMKSQIMRMVRENGEMFKCEGKAYTGQHEMSIFTSRLTFLTPRIRAKLTRAQIRKMLIHVQLQAFVGEQRRLFFNHQGSISEHLQPETSQAMEPALLHVDRNQLH